MKYELRFKNTAVIVYKAAVVIKFITERLNIKSFGLKKVPKEMGMLKSRKDIKSKLKAG